MSHKPSIQRYNLVAEFFKMLIEWRFSMTKAPRVGRRWSGASRLTSLFKVHTSSNKLPRELDHHFFGLCNFSPFNPGFVDVSCLSPPPAAKVRIPLGPPFQAALCNLTPTNPYILPTMAVSLLFLSRILNQPLCKRPWLTLVKL